MAEQLADGMYMMPHACISQICHRNSPSCYHESTILNKDVDLSLPYQQSSCSNMLHCKQQFAVSQLRNVWVVTYCASAVPDTIQLL